ncbi:phosphatidylserine decarboxylase related protein [Flavobacteria bacterium MS024-3C]|mgnify:FL=1|jgi:phosphatidylserine decarboxylase|nr:phosphatidylserine decarboxylase related protein [Flavobacteria bacterium MS024-3C]KRO81594.1 MAG: phosphatidylserine decarboxylase [Polaribacter sp. BACL8 MAG-120531-bin13]KRP03299.1 MAG: phosphatidylserine decarboxylase [Polaribacter sp. BACL8 MAG-120619-bin41]KRP11189.1 MAG: phosphatidylserine decarboxylase [Polaribacter sp. BACL8 MAG-120419-bin8]MBT4839175.1 phosphatidylserine decarboxylase family protein [Flavobacteriaceae bacterium]NQV63627.1 phosphatidylserine decarboxylase family pr|tara:strand:- start:5706 stop:6371 length:666 start_codon:yes stop_codon:yes gene_type:complete
MFHREGFKIIAITFIIVGVIALTADTYITQDLIKYGVQGVALAVLVLILQFFRNPKRAVQFNLNEIIAPVDGKVVVIEEVEEKEYFQGKRKQVSIFMSPLNVHVTRYPVSGVIQYSKYHPGKYLVAWHPKASEENERTTIVIKTPKFGDILYRQIAGALARRIVNYAKKGDKAIQGADAGFIKFGSRVDLFLPLDCIVTVGLNQKVVGAKTVIATLSDGDE